MKFKEQRRLVSVEVTFLNDRFYCAGESEHDTVVKTSKEGFCQFLKSIQATDSGTSPRSVRGISFVKMVDDIISNTENIIFVWNTVWKQIPRYLIID